MADIQSLQTNDQGIVQAAPQAANTPPPHARLMNMIQGLAVGLGAFATSAATKGREGGPEEVQAFEANKQAMQMRQQEQARQQADFESRQKLNHAQLLMSQLQYNHALAMMPKEEKEKDISLSNAAVSEFANERTTAQSMGYDISDPQQKAEFERAASLGNPAQSPGSIVVKFGAGQDTRTVMNGLTSALPNGKSLGDYFVMPFYNDNNHGTGGEITLVPRDSQVMQSTATPMQIRTAAALAEGTLAQAKALGLGDNDLIKKLDGDWSTFSSALAAGGKPSRAAVFAISQQVVGPAKLLIEQTKQAQAETKEQADIQKTQQEAIATTRGNQPPTKDQIDTFTTQTLPSYTHVPPAQQKALAREMQQARTVTEANGIQARADATEKAGVMAQLTRDQTATMKELAFAQDALKSNEKIWSDPQHGYLQTVSAANATKQALAAGASGNGLAASMAPTMVVLGVNSFNQTHRISPAEADAANMPGGYAERFNAWADKAFKGETSPQVRQEGIQLMDVLIQQAHDRAVQGSQLAAKTGNVPLNRVSAVDSRGNITTLDKVIPPPGATMKVPGSDGRLHWSDGKSDLGPVN